jgi:hypothetical protein
MVQDFETKQLLKFELGSSSTTFGEKLEIHFSGSQTIKYIYFKELKHTLSLQKVQCKTSIVIISH